MRCLSCDTNIIVPANSCIISSRASLLGISKWVVGSSKTNTLGFVISSRASSSLPLSPPLKDLTCSKISSPLNRNLARKLRASPIAMFLICRSASITVKSPGISSEPCLKYPTSTLCPRYEVPFSGGISPRIVLRSVVFPIPLLPIMAVVVSFSISLSGTSNSFTASLPA